MAHLPIVEILLYVLSAGSVNANDWMTMVLPTEYFKSRQIDPTIDRMIDFAIADIKTPKAQIRQLAALMHLADESDKFKSAENYELNRLAIEEVAAGKRGLDPAGFGQEYALRLLDKLDGKKRAPAKHRPLRLDALDWFPAGVKLALAFDMRSLQDVSGHARKEILAKLSEYSRLNLYDQLETMGNLRVDRTAFATTDGPTPGERKTFIRVSGKGNQAWIADALNQRTANGLNVSTAKDADGTPIMTLLSRHGGLAFVLVGNTDMIAVASEDFNAPVEAAIKEVLAVRAKKKPHATGGPLKDRLAQVPDKAIGFLVGDLPESIRAELKQAVDPLPAKFAVYAERTEMGIDLRMEASLKDVTEAGRFVGKIGALRKEGIDGLQKALKAPAPADGLPLPLQGLLSLLDSVQVQQQESGATIRAFMSNGLIRELGESYAARNRRADGVK